MQDYILIKRTRGPARLSLGIIGELPESWQPIAHRLLERRQLKVGQPRHARRDWQNPPAAVSQHTAQTFQHIHS